jgi:hypothetical protein
MLLAVMKCSHSYKKSANFLGTQRMHKKFSFFRYVLVLILLLFHFKFYFIKNKNKLVYITFLKLTVGTSKPMFDELKLLVISIEYRQTTVETL